MAGLPPALVAAFGGQAQWCWANGTPPTAVVCDAVVQTFDAHSATGRMDISWSGIAAADERVTGGRNALVNARHAFVLRALCPPAAKPPVEALAAALRLDLQNASHAQLPTLRLTMCQRGTPKEHLLAHAHLQGAFIQWH